MDIRKSDYSKIHMVSSIFNKGAYTKIFTLIGWSFLLFLSTNRLRAQTTESFENKSGTTFTSNAQGFTLLSNESGVIFKIRTAVNGGNTGDYYADTNPDANEAGDGANVTIKTTDGTDITVKSLYLWITTGSPGFGATLSTMTLTGRKDGNPVPGYSFTKNFNSAAYVLVDFATEGFSLTNVDEIVITTTANGDYIALDDFTWGAAVASNSAPVIGGASAGQAVNDNATISPFSAITVTDADVADNVTATITLDDNAKGVITGADAGAGPYTMNGKTPAAMQTALRALVFNPTDNRTATSETTTFTVVVNDGTVDATNNTTTVISSAVGPAITAVSIPNTTMKVGSVVTATITVTSDADNYTTGSGGLSGTIGGFTLGSLSKINNTTYTATFTVTESGTDVAAGSDIPISVTLTDSGGKAGNTFTSAISQNADAIDANTPSAPSTPDLSAGSDTGSSSTDNTTSDTTPTFIGTAEANSTVSVTSSVNGSLGTTTANGAGNWSFTSGALTSNTSHNITATATDAAGNVSSASSALSITLDSNNPTFSSSSPADNAIGVSASGDITITFNENIVFGTGNIQVINVTDGSNSFTIDAANPGAQASISNAVLTINPNVDLNESANYAIQIAATAIKDIAGNNYAGILDNTTLDFTTADVTAPTLQSSSPADGATNVTLSQNLTLTFDDNMVKGTGNIVIKRSADNSTFETIDVTSGAVTITTTQVTINPTGTLQKGTGYYLEIDATALDDDAGNSYAGISGATTLNFSTVDVVINEVVTDPQQDWSANNFNGTAGASTISDGVDEFVELLIKSAGINFTGWTIELNDGSNVIGDLTNTGAFDATAYSGTGTFNNTAVGDYLVLGNVDGAGAMNNTGLTINLKDPGGAIVDAVVIGGGAGEAPTGDASSAANESVQRFTNGLDTGVDNSDFTKGPVTMGAANTGPSVTLSQSTTTFAEAAGTNTVTATLSAASSQTTTITIGVKAGGTATITNDFTLSTTSIVIAAGNTTGTATLTAVQDALDETDETVTIEITGVTNGTENGSQEVASSITDDDAAPTVSLSQSTTAFAEAAATNTITATLSAVSGQDVTVTVGVKAGGTATITNDFTLSSTSIVITAGNTTGTATLTAVQDALDETDETVTIEITGVANGTENGTQEVVSSITDDDAAPTVTLSQSTTTFAEAAGTNIITATLSAVSGQDVTVTVGVKAGGTATITNDFTLSTTSIVIAAGNTTGTATLTAAQDALDETNETVTIEITGVTNGTENGTQEVSSSITDDDAAPTVTLSQSTTAFAEAAGTNTITATLSAVSGQDVTVTVGVKVGGTATITNDFTLSTTSIVIAAGNTTGTATLTAVQDALDETDETVTIEITGVANGTEDGTQEVASSITDDDAEPTVTLSVGSASIAEAAGTSTIVATLSAISAKDVTVTLAYSGTATVSVDYNDCAIVNSITIPAGSLSANAGVDLEAVQDANPEANETIIIDITGVTNGTESGNQQQTVTITDDDTPNVQFTTTASNGAESVSTANLTVDLSIASGLTVTVNYAVTGTATAGTDYTLVNGTLTFVPTDVQETISIAGIVDDAILEANETVIITLSNPGNANLGANTVHTYTINNNDAAAVTIADVSGAENGGAITVTATLDNAVQGGFTVDVSTANGTATTADNDYTAVTNQTLTFAGTAGETKTFTVTPTGDTKFEANETLTISQSNLAATTLAVNITDGASVTINNDDIAPTVTLTQSTATFAEAAGTNTITATLSAVSGLDVTVTIGVKAGGTATIVNDFTLSTTSIVITAGNTTGTATLTAVQDALDETDETVTVEITGVNNGTENGTQEVASSITDDDAAPTVTLSQSTTTFAEAAGTNTVTATLSAVSGLDVTVTIGVKAGGTATIVNDFTLSTTSIVITAGNTTGTATMTAVQDVLDETDETVTIEITGVANGTENGSQEVASSITDDDAAPTVTLTQSTTTFAEAAGTNTVTATLSAVSGQDVTVTVGVKAGGTATIVNDFTVSTTSIVIAAGNTTGTATLTAVQDVIDEDNETVTIEITGVTNGTENGSQEVASSITDDDAEPTVTLSVGSASIAEAAGTSTITATLSAVSAKDVTVTLAYSGTATSGTDYNNTASTTITITAGNLSAGAAVGITATQDVNPEANETIIIDITGVANGTESGSQQQTVTITDDDTPNVQFTVTASNGAESVATANLTVDLSIASGLTVTVDYAVTGTATGSGTDYTLANGTLTFVPTDVQETISIAGIVDDAILEANETVIITLSNPGNANLGANTVHTYTINNNDAAAVTIADVSGAENGGAITVTATLDNAVQGGFTVDVSTANGTATTADNDYTAVAGQTLTFAGTAGETQTFTIAPTADTKLEANETVSISQGNLAATSLAVNIADGATVTINNDDNASVTIADASGAENGGPITVTATLNNAVQGGFTVDVNTADGTATSASDYTAVTSQTLTFTGTAGETQTFTVTPTNDAVEEATETLTVSMDNLAATTLGVTISDNATITITDDDDNTAPTGYAVTFDDALINSLEQATSKFTFTGAEVGATYNYTVSSTGGGTNVTGTGTIATATDKITMADLSGLGDGTLTLSVTLKDASNNTGAAQTASTVHKATIAAPALSPADNSIDILPGADLTMTFAEAMTKGTGNITIKKKSDNSVLETIDVTSSKVTIASGLVTINPDNPILPPATEFYVNIDAGAFKDNAGNNYTGISDNTSWTFTIIAAPVVTSVALPANNTYKIGDVLDFTASFTLPITTTGTPSIPVTIGTSTKAADLKATAANSATAVFSYTIAEGDLDTDGIAVGTTINLNGGTIKDQFGTDALTALNNIAPGANVKVDGVRAIPAITTSAVPLVNGAFSVTFQYSEAVTGLSVDDITVTNGTASNFTNVTSGLTWTADIAPTADGSVTVNLGAGVANDAAGNASAAGTAISREFDGTAPTAISIARTGSNPVLTASAGFRATFSENVTGVDITDFEVMLTGTATGTLNTVAQVDAKTYDITLTGISGQGSIGLNLKDDDSILDAANNPLAGALAGEVYVTNFLPTDLGLSTASIAENNALSAEVGSFTTTDQDATDTHAYALVAGAGDADNGSFLIAGDKLFAGAIFNFEARASYSIRVRTTDNNGGTFEKPLTITIADVNEAPTAMSLSNNEIDEDDTPGLLVGQMSTTDVDNGETFTYSLVTGAGDENNLLFTFSGDELRTAAPIDFESSTTLSIRVRVTDAGGLGYEEVFAITVNNVEIEPIREFDKDKNDAKIKNFFSPNEDGTNDAWVIEDILDNPINEVKVFSQNGTLLFSERNYKNTWKGTYNGKAIPPGTYYYEINVYNGESIIKGFLTIIRSKNN